MQLYTSLAFPSLNPNNGTLPRNGVGFEGFLVQESKKSQSQRPKLTAACRVDRRVVRNDVLRLIRRNDVASNRADCGDKQTKTTKTLLVKNCLPEKSHLVTWLEGAGS